MRVYPILTANDPELYHKYGFETRVISFSFVGKLDFEVYQSKNELSEILDAIQKYGKPEAFEVKECKTKWGTSYCTVYADIDQIESIIQ